MSEQTLILERLHAAFLSLFHIDVPSPDTDLLNNGILDSLQLVELLLQIEKDFGRRIAIETVELEDLRTLGRLARLLSAPAHARVAVHALASNDA